LRDSYLVVSVSYRDILLWVNEVPRRLVKVVSGVSPPFGFGC